jgi:hypothetical protein
MFQPNSYLFHLATSKPGTEAQVEDWIRRHFEKLTLSVARVEKEDLSLVRLPSPTLDHDLPC